MSGMESVLEGERIAATTISFKVIVDGTLEAAPDLKDLREITTEIPSSGQSNTYAWIGEAPEMREWLSERSIARLRSAAFTIENQDWAIGIEIAQNDLDDDQLGQTKLRLQAMALRGAGQALKLAIGKLASGFVDLCYDGLPMFSASHKEGESATQSNMLTSSLDDTGAYDTAIQRMMEFKTEQGEPFGSVPTHLIVGPSLRRTAMDIIGATALANGASNVNVGSTKLIVSPRLVGADAAKWFLLDASKPVRALILQRRKPITFTSSAAPGDYHRFLTGNLLYGIEARHAVGYGLWQAAVGSNGTT
jgi:phage major head subunit gpT-like protein